MLSYNWSLYSVTLSRDMLSDADRWDNSRKIILAPLSRHLYDSAEVHQAQLDAYDVLQSRFDACEVSEWEPSVAASKHAAYATAQLSDWAHISASY